MKKMSNDDVKQFLLNVTNMYQSKMSELSKLDSLVGDGDHGVSMARGALQAQKEIENCSLDTSIDELFKLYANGLMQGIGGAVGPLFGTIFNAFGTAAQNKTYFDADCFRNGINESTSQVMQFGGAQPGDKTMVDAMVSAKNAMSSTDDFEELSKEVMDGAYNGMKATINMQAKKGRSKYRKTQSVGFQDAGATSYYYLIREIYNYINEVKSND